LSYVESLKSRLVIDKIMQSPKSLLNEIFFHDVTHPKVAQFLDLVKVSRCDIDFILVEYFVPHIRFIDLWMLLNVFGKFNIKKQPP